MKQLVRAFPVEDLSALGVHAEATSLGRYGRSWDLGWLVGFTALYSLTVAPEPVRAGLGAGGWLILIILFAAWQGWLIKRGFQSVA